MTAQLQYTIQHRTVLIMFQTNAVLIKSSLLLYQTTVSIKFKGTSYENGDTSLKITPGCLYLRNGPLIRISILVGERLGELKID